MVRTMCKNTFINFVDDANSVTQSGLERTGSFKRSRSAEVSPSEALQYLESGQDLTQRYLQGLDAVLSVGISSPDARANQKISEESAAGCSDECTANAKQGAEETAQSDCSLEELHALHEKLAKALSIPQKPFKAGFHINSAASFSSMSTASEVSPKDTIVEEPTAEVKKENFAEAAPRMKHALVPRTRDLAEMFKNSSQDEPPTTMMIRNIPGRYTQNEFLKEFKALGFESSFDFLYLPMDKASAKNVGYAFVNFTDPAWAEKCQATFDGYRFKRYQRPSNSKVAQISVAHLQGLEKNMQHYRKAAVNMAKEKRRRPMVMANIALTLA